MQNNDLNRYCFTGDMLKVCLLTLLLSHPGFAQSTNAVQPADGKLPTTENTDNSSGPAVKPGSEKKDKPAPKRPPATRFTPTEKLRADDAVAFPVDI